MPLCLFARASCLAFVTSVAFAQCEAPRPVRELLQKSEFRGKLIETQAQKDSRDRAFESALREHPYDYFILSRQLSSFRDPNQALDWARAQRRLHPDLVYEMIEAEATLGLDTPEAIRRLEALKAAHLDQPRIYLQLATAFGFGKFRNKLRVEAELDSYRNLCPDSADSRFLSELLENGSAVQIADEAVTLRKHLEALSGDPDFDLWETLWKLEFKSHPLAEHAALRQKVGEDLARFEALPAPSNDDIPKRSQAAWLTFLRGGYESAGDQTRMDKVTTQLQNEYPKSREALRILQERFRKDHPFPPRGDEEKGIAWRRNHLATVREWLKNFPDDASLLFDVVSDLKEFPDTKPEQFTAAVDSFQTAYAKDGNFYTMPPIEWTIAEAYIKFKIRLDQVPVIIQAGYRNMRELQKRSETDDRSEYQQRDEAADYYQVRKARLLVDCYTVTKDAAKAQEAIMEVHLKNPDKQKADFLVVKAESAEIEDRKADALMLYRAALDAVPANAGQHGRDEMLKDVARLWKDLGGTPEGYALLIDKPKPVAAVDSRWEKPKNALPSFTLTDLQGKTWALARLKGKTLLINIWATWCGPCMAEHPQFQKLYDQLKQRPDVSILTFNVDEDLGKVAPYVAQHNYTFPVIPAKDIVDTVAPQLAIPQNWVVDAQGELQWEQIGFSNDDAWGVMMLRKLDEVAKSTTAPQVRNPSTSAR